MCRAVLTAREELGSGCERVTVQGSETSQRERERQRGEQAADRDSAEADAPMQVLQARGTSAAASFYPPGTHSPSFYPSSTAASPYYKPSFGLLAHDRGARAAGSAMCSGSGGLERAPAPRQTATHVFEEADRLGRGGSCDVYRAVEKGTGQRHALKVLREATPALQVQLLQEAQTLSRLNSPKVVTFLHQGHEEGTGRPVVVVELCEGGSLLGFLQQPENGRGLVDDEFLHLLSDLAEGLSYIRGKGLVHRDVKPGNILRHIHTSGRVEYKLSDFGTSREAHDSEQTTSIVGTEEYLHPVLYRNAFFSDLSSAAAISPLSGELWSVGCTLYHAITASLPFRPLGGRGNRKAMLLVISQKPPGAISGQQRNDGSFVWSASLPPGCNMSESLRDQVQPLLQNVLEAGPTQWSFATFLAETRRLRTLLQFHVCDTECGDCFRLYVAPDQSLAELQDALAYHTELPGSQQLLFHRVQPLTALGARACVSDLKVTTLPDQPLLLVSGPATREGRCRRPPVVEPQVMASEASLDEDISSSFRLCSDLHRLSVMAASLFLLPTILFSAILAIRTALTSTLSTVETRFRVMSATCQERQSRLAMMTQIMDTLPAATPSELPAKLAQAQQLCDQLRDSLWQLKYRLDDSRRSAETLHLDNTICHVFLHDDSSRALEHIFTKAKEAWSEIEGRRHKVPLSYLQQEKHGADRTLLNTLSREATQRWKHLLTKRATLLENYSSQVRQLCERVRAAQHVEQELLQLKDLNENFSALLNQIWSLQGEGLSKRATEQNVSTSTVKPPATRPRPFCNQLEALLSEDLPTLETFHIDSEHLEGT